VNPNSFENIATIIDNIGKRANAMNKCTTNITNVMKNCKQ